MKDKKILLNISEILKNPISTGIQRVSYKTFEYLLKFCSVEPFYIDVDSFVAYVLPADQTFSILSRVFSKIDSFKESIHESIVLIKNEKRALELEEILRYDAIFNAELWYDFGYLKFYRLLSEKKYTKVFSVVHDFLPFLNPELFRFSKDTPSQLLNFIQYLQLWDNLTFVSNQSRNEYVNRILRKNKSSFIICPLGADSFGTKKPEFIDSKIQFTVLSTLEPRKNHTKILDAFEKLWSNGINVHLTFIGKKGWESDEFFERIDSLEKNENRFRIIHGLNDEEVKEIIVNSRATIYASEHEGFGLPPLESLALGIPVIVSSQIPAIKDIEPYGQVRLDLVNAFTIQEAVEKMMDAKFAQEKTEEINLLNLPTWDDMGAFLANWVNDKTI